MGLGGGGPELCKSGEMKLGTNKQLGTHALISFCS